MEFEIVTFVVKGSVTYKYIDYVLSIKNPDFKNYLGQMYLAELEIKDTTESNTSASYLDLLLSIESDGQLSIVRSAFESISCGRSFITTHLLQTRFNSHKIFFLFWKAKSRPQILRTE